MFSTSQFVSSTSTPPPSLWSSSSSSTGLNPSSSSNSSATGDALFDSICNPTGGLTYVSVMCNTLDAWMFVVLGFLCVGTASSLSWKFPPGAEFKTTFDVPQVIVFGEMVGCILILISEMLHPHVPGVMALNSPEFAVWSGVIAVLLLTNTMWMTWKTGDRSCLIRDMQWNRQFAVVFVLVHIPYFVHCKANERRFHFALGLLISLQFFVSQIIVLPYSLLLAAGHHNVKPGDVAKLALPLYPDSFNLAELTDDDIQNTVSAKWYLKLYYLLHVTLYIQYVGVMSTAFYFSDGVLWTVLSALSWLFLSLLPRMRYMRADMARWGWDDSFVVHVYDQIGCAKESFAVIICTSIQHFLTSIFSSIWQFLIRKCSGQQQPAAQHVVRQI